MNKKRITIILLIILLAVCVFIAYDTNKRNELKKQLYDNLDIVFENEEGGNPILEYDNKTVKLKSLIKQGEEYLSTEQLNKEIDLSKLKENKISLELKAITSKGDEVNKTIDKSVNVIDTNAPVIELENDYIEIKYGEEFKLSNNINVYDIVDGQIPYCEDSLMNNTFTIVTDFNPYTPGEYKVEVYAKDKNDLESQAEFTILVKDKPKTPSANISNHTGEKKNYISIGSYGANYYYGDPYDEAGFAALVDAANSCAVATLGSGATFFGDHNYQGMSQMLYNDTLYLYDANGNETAYKKAGTYYQGDGYVWDTTDGHSMYYDYLGAIVTQTCDSSGKYIWVAWN